MKPAMRKEYFWALITLVIAISLAFVLINVVERDATPEEQLYQGVPLDAHLLGVDKDALELAYKDHLKLLFSVWLKDDISTVQRINNGLRNARRAYAHAAEQIERRERALKSK